MDHQVEGMLKVSMESIKNMVAVDTIVGKPIIGLDQTMVIPISKVKMGFACGGTDFKGGSKKDETPFGGGTGGNVSITPVAFLIITDNNIKVMHLQNETHLYEKIIDKMPDAINYVSNKK